MVIKTEDYTVVTYGRSSMIVYNKSGRQVYYTASIKNVPLWTKAEIRDYAENALKYCGRETNG